MDKLTAVIKLIILVPVIAVALVLLGVAFVLALPLFLVSLLFTNGSR